LVVIPSLDHLSSGQSILFNMFATIIRYADKGDISKSITLTDIEGIVIIDEIDAHLHTELQYKVLPKLIKLFPKVQFIITSHSPLFLLGMKDEYDEQGFKIIEMPKGEFISTERFSEFRHSFTYYKQTKAHEDELRKFIEPFKRPILITEGKTDAQIIRAAWNKLFSSKEMNFEVIPSGIEIQESERVGSAETVRRTLEYIAGFTSQPSIGLFDNDREGNEQFKGLNKSCFEDYDLSKDYRKHRLKEAWGLLLPVPASRSNFVTPDDATQRYLVLEHYFSDDLLKQYNKYGKNILGTEIFTIIGDKNSFATKVDFFGVLEFENFKILFEKIENLLSRLVV